jgi:tRNA-guanine family transglycosylase
VCSSDLLAKLNKIDINIGAVFSSHIDGKKFVLSPEKSIQIQKSINSDILMVLDVCPALTNEKEKLIKDELYQQVVMTQESLEKAQLERKQRDFKITDLQKQLIVDRESSKKSIP